MATLQRDASVRIPYAVQGEGPAILLINGATLPLGFWDPVVKRLASRFRVIRFDQRNAGASDFTGSFTLLDVAADIAALLTALEIERAVIVGHAWGGRVAQVFARDYPHRTRGLIVCGTGGQFPPDLDPAWLSAMGAARKAGERATWDDLLERIYCAPGYSLRDAAGFVATGDVIWNAPRVRGAKPDMRVAPSSSYWGTAMGPALLIYAEHDRFGTPANARDLSSRLPEARLEVLTGAGHLLVREQSERVVALVGDFMEALPVE
ncbi:MAG: 3-oxoadipate enol-lactonase [Chloroflexi bacterium]|jgi:3-oxoadipate enol-lactonase|nr:MAG: 3-oxoadipate enol-lactonase [Chloroflexota bacterium]